MGPLTGNHYRGDSLTRRCNNISWLVVFLFPNIKKQKYMSVCTSGLALHTVQSAVGISTYDFFTKQRVRSATTLH